MNEPNFDTPDAAETAFYAAFEQADLDAMSAVWDDSDQVVCVHPLGARLEGRSAVRSGWERLFAGGASLKFDLANVNKLYTDEIAIHYVHEDISYGPNMDQRSRAVATNIYRLGPSGWRMVLHHASPGLLPEPTSTSRESSPSIVH